MKLRHCLSAALLAVIAAGCASGPEVVSAWRDPAYQGPAFSKVAVVGLTDRETTRRIFESVFAQKLSDRGVTAMASYEAIPTQEKLPKEEVERIVQEHGIEAIITARVVDREQETQFLPSTTARPSYPEYYGNYYGFYDYSYGFYRGPGSVHSYEVVSIETNVYDTRTFNIVWSGLSKTTDPSNLEQESAGLADSIIAELVASGLLGPTTER
jgi:hypothetical protein